MTFRLDNIKLNIGDGEDKLLAIARKKLKKEVKFFKILKKSLDARDKSRIVWIYSIAFSDEEHAAKPEREKLKNPPKVVIVGAGPAGLFCALRLVEHGVMPVIIERGEGVDERRNSVKEFFDKKKLNVNSNVQFGEGGAGAFSDGKLNTQTHDGLNKDVLELFAKFGAPQEILYLNKPHIGSDKLYGVLKNIRNYIESAGGKYIFNSKFIDFGTSGGGITSAICKDTRTGEEFEIVADCIVLAPGHSARETFKTLAEKGVAMEARDFAVGVRIEHLAEKISHAQYGKDFRFLPPADYKLVSHAGGATVFTFCMCPGGVVIPAASEEGGVVTNGMSLYARDGVNSNSALMVQLKKENFKGGLFGGMDFLRELEQKAFIAGGKDYKAPVQTYRDFAKGRQSAEFGEVKPTYAAGTNFAPLDEVLPSVVVSALKAAVPDMNKRLKGFSDQNALLTGVESRFSSTIRVLRDAYCESLTVKGLYPCGEGCGYSGGITSSAADGLKIAELIFEKHKNH